jgi:tRNA threonylcarbamoyl adenosine modification protein YeaZ
MTDRPILAFDTATSLAVAALGDLDGRVLAQTAWTAGYRHGEELLVRIDAMLAEAGVGLRDLSGIVVGTGPGAFTGLRVGLATAKGLAHGLGVGIVGIPTRSALLAAAGQDDPSGAAFALLLPAGPSDRLLIGPDGRTTLLGAPGAGSSLAAAPEAGPALDPRLVDAPTEWTLVAVDLADRAPEAALARGERARALLADALVRLGARELAAGRANDLAGLVPDYVTLPRGVRAETGVVEWSRDPA